MNLAPNIRLNKCGLLVLTCLVLTFCYYILFSSEDNHLSYVHKNVEGINMRKLLIGSIQVRIRFLVGFGALLKMILFYSTGSSNGRH